MVYQLTSQLTNQLTNSTEQSHSEQLMVPYLVKKFPAGYGIRSLITLFTKAVHLCLS